MSKKLLVFITISSAIILLMIVMAKGDLRMGNNTSNIDGLLIPTKNDAKEMINQYPGMIGAPNKILPLNYDIKLAVKKGLCTGMEFGDKYLNMQALYRKALEQYLSELLNLQIYDNMLTDSELRFIPIDKERESLYQKYSTFGYKYVYLRNNLPIEYLDKQDLSILEKYINDGKTDVTEELVKLVSRTYQYVIIVLHDRAEDTPIGYSNDGQKIAPNYALVLEIGHATEFDEEGNFVDTKNESKKRAYLTNEFIPFMEKKLSEQLGSTVIVFHEWD